MEKINKKLMDVSDSLKLLDKTVSSNTKAISELTDKFDLLEQYFKKNFLRFLGIAENNDEDLVEIIVSLINNTLKVPCANQDIDYTFRVSKLTQADNTRAVLVNFVSNIKRTQVFNSRKLLKGTNLSVYEDLTRKRYDLLKEAKKRIWHGPQMVKYF
ncbi:hypothetical protein NQ314_020025 [Rhamnusium bicolor]|uniref:Uncharacterized protein n=1 Tax=Rhamnusium bicolor TaxID=1586634 RepID=A0AAV8WM85_9CUCU|nr:hypothetical protein NQ314_020025 [Rhamnusium bicolor]